MEGRGGRALSARGGGSSLGGRGRQNRSPGGPPFRRPSPGSPPPSRRRLMWKTLGQGRCGCIDGEDDGCLRAYPPGPCLCGCPPADLPMDPGDPDLLDGLLAPGPLKHFLAELQEDGWSREDSFATAMSEDETWQSSDPSAFEDIFSDSYGDLISDDVINTYELAEEPCTPLKAPLSSPAVAEDVDKTAVKEELWSPSLHGRQASADGASCDVEAVPRSLLLPCSCGRRVSEATSFKSAAKDGRTLTLPGTACLVWLVVSEKSAPEAAELCGMCLTTFKHRMRERGFASFPSKGARSINRALRELQAQLASARAEGQANYANMIQGRLVACVAERELFLSTFLQKLETRDRALRVAPSKAFMRLRSRMHKCKYKKGQKQRALAKVSELISEGLSERVFQVSQQVQYSPRRPLHARTSSSGVEAVA